MDRHYDITLSTKQGCNNGGCLHNKARLVCAPNQHARDTLSRYSPRTKVWHSDINNCRGKIRSCSASHMPYQKPGQFSTPFKMMQHHMITSPVKMPWSHSHTIPLVSFPYHKGDKYIRCAYPNCVYWAVHSIFFSLSQELNFFITASSLIPPPPPPRN